MGETKERANPRKKVTYGCLGLFVALGALIALVPTGANDEAIEHGEREQIARSKAMNDEQLTPTQEKVAAFLVQASVPMVFCGSTVDYALGEIDRAAAGKTNVIEAYEEVRRGVADCTTAKSDISRVRPADVAVDAMREPAELALRFCSQSIKNRLNAMIMAEKILENKAGALGDVADYRALISTAKSEEYSCRFALAGIGDEVKLPQERVDRVRPK